LIRKINACSINDFILKLSHENWDSVFSSDDVNAAFNSFLDSYLRIFNSSFPLKRVYTTKKNNNWITLGILTSCKRKRELYLACRSSKNPDSINHYKKYCKILSVVIKEAKKLRYAEKIKQSSNKNKTIWDIVKLENNKAGNNDMINYLSVDGNIKKSTRNSKYIQ